MQFTMTKRKVDPAFIVPFGISLILAVLGFAVSTSLSIYRLKAMAALRAKIMQRRTKSNLSQVNSCSVSLKAKVNPINAKGRAKMVWLNFMRDR